MKKLWFTCIAISFALACQGQNKPYDTLPYALEHHKKKLLQFAKEQTLKGKVVLLGNSIIEFADWKKLLRDTSVINRGVAGDNTFGVLNRLDDVIALQPKALFMEIGINDIGRNIPTNVIAGNIFKIVTRVRAESPATKIFVLSVLPTNDASQEKYPEVFNKNDRTILLNDRLRQTEKEVGFTFIDLFKELHDSDNKLKAEYAKADGLHLNDAGYQLLVEMLRSKKFL